MTEDDKVQKNQADLNQEGAGRGDASQENSGSAKAVSDDKLAVLEKQRDEYLAGWQRAKADFANYRKEEYERLQEMARYGSEDLIKDLIIVLDNFDLGLRSLEKAGPVEKGVYLIRTQIEDILKKRGLDRIDLKPGDEFNPKIAEALTEVESAAAPPGSIVEVVEPGYKLHDKVLRAARVIVAKGK